MAFPHPKRIVPGLLASVGVCAALVACRDLARNRTILRMSYWGGDMDEALGILEQEYEALHPDTDIVLELQSGRDYDMWMRVQILGRRPPPVMQAQWGQLPQYIGSGKLVCLDPLLDQPNPYTGQRWRDMYFRARLDSVRDAHGKLYIAPLNQVKTAIFYNKVVFAACGLEPPDTFEELMHLSLVLRDRGYVPLGVGNVAMSELVAWCSSVFFDSVYRDQIPELDVLRPDGRVDGEEVLRGYSLGIIDPGDARYQAMWTLFKRWSATWNADFNNADGNMIRGDFLAGRVAMMLTGCWMVKHLELDLADQPPNERFEFAVFPLPNITEETSPWFRAPLGAVGAVGVGFVLPTDAATDAASRAVDWLQFLTRPESVEILQRDSTMLPCIHGVPMQPEMEGFLPLMDGTFPDLRIQEGFVFPDVQAGDTWFRMFQDYMSDRIDLDEFTQRWADACAEGVSRRIEREGFDTSTW